jgi:hypothetical protein
MKLKQMMVRAAFAAVMTLGAATTHAMPAAYPTIPLSISGTLKYTANDSLSMNVPIKTLTYNTQTLINLLNASSDATNVLRIVTGKTKIPAGSYFLWNPDYEELTITNTNGFSFPMYGSYTNGGTTFYYDYGYLDIDDEGLIGTYDLAAKTLAGTEKDMTGIYFYFYDGGMNYNEIEIYGKATLTWTYGAAKGGYQKATLSVTMSANGNDDCYVDDFEAIPGSFSASGSGSSTVSTGMVPFYWEW